MNVMQGLGIMWLCGGAICFIATGALYEQGPKIIAILPFTAGAFHFWMAVNHFMGIVP